MREVILRGKILLVAGVWAGTQNLTDLPPLCKADWPFLMVKHPICSEHIPTFITASAARDQILECHISVFVTVLVTSGNLHPHAGGWQRNALFYEFYMIPINNCSLQCLRGDQKDRPTHLHKGNAPSNKIFIAL